jgi:RNA polymerase sigma-70 factor (ECF subfamily)
MSFLHTSLPSFFTYAVASTAEDRRSPSLARMNEPASAPPPDERHQEDARLLERIAQGDKAAFADLYDRFSRPLYATALRVVHDAAEAQDIVHDSFVTLWEKAGAFASHRGTAFSWALTLVRNRAIDRVRMRRRRAELLEASSPSDLGYDENSSGLSADASATLGDDASAVRAAVATLPQDQKRALELAFFSGLTQQEIAEKLAEPLGTVKARIRRALLKLRDSLARRK